MQKLRLPSLEEIYHWALPLTIKAGIGILILVAGFFIIRLLKKWLRKELTHKKFDPSLEPFILNTVIITLQILLVIGTMQVAGIQMTIFAALVGAIGVAAGLALSGTLQNFTSGILILLLRPYKVGDNIIAQGQDGIVESIELFYTVMITFDHKTVIIPNSKLSNEVILNLSRLGKRRLDIEMKFSYGYDLHQIKNTINEVLGESPHILKDPLTMVGVSELEPDGFKLITTAWVHSPDYEQAKYETKEKIVERLKSNGVKLPGM